MTFEQLLRILLFVFLGLITVPFHFALLFPVLFLPKDSYISRYLRAISNSVFSDTILISTGINVKYRGEENLTGKPTIFLFLHGSNIDGFVIYSTYILLKGLCSSIPIGVGKKALFNIPVFGWLFRLQGHVCINRSNLASAIDSLNGSIEMIDSGYSVLLAPEGTRRRSPSVGPEQILPFKKGPFHVSTKTKCDIIPVTLMGAHSSWKPGDIFPTPRSTVLVDFGPKLDLYGKSVDTALCESRKYFEKRVSELKPGETEFEPIDMYRLVVRYMLVFIPWLFVFQLSL